jgi:tRNA nucleotidyltransferase/poly(A) polymerase
MSDYIYMLESHLSADQNRVVAAVREFATEANLNLFLTGGAMRDMVAGLRIRDLDFVVEGQALKLAASLCERAGARLVRSDEATKSAELVFEGGVTAQVAMSRREKYARTGAKPQVFPATIQEDLRGRDFTANAIALSLNKASHGLLLDPMNGLADIGRRELRAVSAYGFYDDPSRLLRLIRFRVRLGFSIEERTKMQVANAREAGVERSIPVRALGEEMKKIAVEDSPGEILDALEEAGLLALISPVLAGPKRNQAGIAKYEKGIRLLPDDSAARAARLGPFLYVLTEKLAPKEKQAFIKGLELAKPDVDLWQKLEARSKKLEAALRAPRIRKASQAYQIVSTAAPDEVIFLLYHSSYKQVQERLRNYYLKSLPALQEISPEEWAAVEGKPGTPRYAKARQELIADRLDRKPPKVEEPPPGEQPASAALPPDAPASASVTNSAFARRVR